MLNKNEDLKTALFCIVALLLGLLAIVLTGCEKLVEQEPFYELTTPHSQYEMHDLTYPLNEYDASKVT